MRNGETARWRSEALLHLTVDAWLTYHHRMDQELQDLGELVARILALSRHLADDNLALREQLSVAQSNNAQLQERICEARSRVEAALSRLPANALDAAGTDSPTS